MKKIGTQEWWESEPWERPRGPLDTILRLLEMETISRAKARELVYALTVEREIPRAPWRAVRWES